MLGVGLSLTTQVVLDAIQARLIPTLAGSQYGQLATPITFMSDFEVEVEFATTSSSAGVLLGNSSVDTSLLYVSAAGLITGRFGESTTNRVTTTAVNDGKVHTVIMKRVGTTCSIIVDGVEEYSGVLTLADVVFDRVGNYVSGLEFNGQILSVKFTDNGTVVANYVFNSGSDLYQLARGEALGVELSGDPNCDNESYWDVTNGATFDGEGVDISYSGVAAALLQRLATSEPLTVGTEVLCEVQVSSYTSGFCDVKIGTTTYGTVSSTGTFYFVGEVTVDGRIQLNATDFVGTITKLSYKKLPDNTCLLNNFALTDWNRYTQQRNILHDAGVIALGWVSDNLVINGGFDTDTVWAKGIGWSIGSGVATGVAGTASVLRQNAGTVNDDKYLSKIKVSGYVAGTVFSYVGGQIGAALTSDGEYTEIIADGGTSSQTGAWKDLNFNGNIDNVSVQHLLEVA